MENIRKPQKSHFDNPSGKTCIISNLVYKFSFAFRASQWQFIFLLSYSLFVFSWKKLWSMNGTNASIPWLHNVKSSSKFLVPPLRFRDFFKTHSCFCRPHQLCWHNKHYTNNNNNHSIQSCRPYDTSIVHSSDLPNQKVVL